MGGGGSKTNNAAMNGPIVGMRGKAGEPFNLSDAAVTVVRDWDKEFQNALDLIENDEKAVGWVLSSLKIVAWPHESHHAPECGIHSAWISLKHGLMVGPQNLSSSVFARLLTSSPLPSKRYAALSSVSSDFAEQSKEMTMLIISELVSIPPLYRKHLFLEAAAGAAAA